MLDFPNTIKIICNVTPYFQYTLLKNASIFSCTCD